MKKFYDICLRNTGEEVAELASELGWTSTNCSVETVFLEASDWGELKSKINQNRADADVLVFEGGDAELNRKAAEDSRMDVILHPEKGRKDSGIDHVIAEEAAENSVAIGFDLKQLEKDPKNRSHILKHWMKNLKLCEKYDTPYLITSGAENKYELRVPRDLESVIEAIGFDGRKAVQKHPKSIVEEAVTDGN